MAIVEITIKDRVASASAGALLVCNNPSDKVRFVFDEEWAEHDVKTARFAWEGKYIDVPFSGDEVEVPEIYRANYVFIGVYADGLTSAPAKVACRYSIKCLGGKNSPPGEDIYNQIMKLINALQAGGVTDEQIAIAVEKYLLDNPIEGANGEDGVGIESVSWSDYKLKLTLTNGESYESPSLKGDRGAAGADGVGIKDVQYTEALEDGANNIIQMEFTDNSAHRFFVRNGKAGADGVSPTVSVSKSGKVTTISITDKGGTKTATVNDGADGSNGKDGTSVTVKSVSESAADGGSNVVTFSDGKTLTIKNGSKGNPGDGATVTAANIKSALGYTPADQADMDTIGQEIFITPGVVKKQAVDVFKDSSHTWEDGLYINYGNGTTGSSSNYYGCADYFEIPDGGRLFGRYRNAALYYPTVALYTENKTFISGEYPVLSSVDDRDEYDGMYGHFYAVPENAKYFRFSAQNNLKSNLEMYVISDVVVGGKVEIPNLAGAKSRIDGKKVVCFGDSLFGMYRGDDSAPAFIAAETGATVYNVGFGGCRMAVHPTSGYGAFSMWALAKAIAEKNWTTQDAQASSGSSYFPDQLALLKSIDFNTVDIAVIHYGTNDFASGNGVPIDNDSDPDDYNSLCGALRYSLDKLLGAYPKLRIYISLPVYRFWTENGATTYAETYLNKIGKTLPEFVEALRGVAAEYNLPVIDGYYGLGINKANASTFLSDGTHHNATGRERFGRFIGENLIAQQGSAKAGMDTAAINALIENAIGSAIGGAY